MPAFDAAAYAYLVHDLAAAPHAKTAKEWTADAKRATTEWHRGLYAAVAAKVASGETLAPRAFKKPWRQSATAPLDANAPLIRFDGSERNGARQCRP